MDPAWVSSIAAVVFGIVAAIAAVFAYLTWRDARRKRIRITNEVTPLLWPGLPHGASLEVTLGGEIPVIHPHSARVQLLVPSPPDVPPGDYNEQPLCIDFGAPVMWLAPVSGRTDGSKIAENWAAQFFDHESGGLRERRPTWPTTIELTPALMSVNKPWEVTVITDGRPTIDIPTQLTNVSFTSSPEPNRKAWRRRRTILAALVVLVAMLAIVSITASIAVDSRRLDVSSRQYILTRPTVAIAPVEAVPGGSVAVLAGGFEPEAALVVRIGKTEIGQLAADGSGRSEGTLRIPTSVVPGAYFLVVEQVAGSRRRASTPLAVAPQ